MKYNYIIYLFAALLTISSVACSDKHNHEAENHEHGSSCSSSSEEVAKESNHSDEIIVPKKQAEMIGLETETVAPAPFRQVIKSSGEIIFAPEEQVSIIATTDGTVLFPNQNIAVGSKVTKGELLSVISTKNSSGQNHPMKEAAAYETAKRAYERAQSLFNEQIISRNEYDQAKLNYETARINYQVNAGNRTSDGIKVSAPTNGYIQARFVNQGQYVVTGQPLFEISKNNNLQLQALVSVDKAPLIAQIQDAYIKVGSTNSLIKISEQGGKLLSKGQSISGNNPYLPVIFSLKSDLGVVSGQYVEVYLLLNERPNILTIPLSALTEEQGHFFVYVQLDEEGFQKREVTLGQENGERAEIINGIKPGDKVVTKGAYQVKMASTSSAIPHGHSH